MRKDFSRAIVYIIVLFILSRGALLLIGFESRALLSQHPGKALSVQYSEHVWLDIWGIWDSAWYLQIARHGYPAVSEAEPDIFNNKYHGNYGFFPLYPLLMRAVAEATGDYFISGIIVSNLALLVASLYLYALAANDGGRGMGLRSVKYLYLFPSAFILSGVFSESVFLALLVMTFYYARRGKWLTAGVVGFFLALSRPVGVFMVLPLVYEYLKSNEFKIRFDLFHLALMPLGLFAFSVYNYYLTGDFLMFAHVKAVVWKTELMSPFLLLPGGIILGPGYNRINAVFAIIEAGILFIFVRKLRFSYFLASILLFLIPLSSGPGSLPGVLRFAVIIFPFFLTFARLGEDRRVDRCLTVSLAILQGVLMVVWCNGYRVII